jgi:hypothetical protein
VEQDLLQHAATTLWSFWNALHFAVRGMWLGMWLGPYYVMAIYVLLALGLVTTFPRKNIEVIKRLIELLALPPLWIFSGLWGAWWFFPRHGTNTPEPAGGLFIPVLACAIAVPIVGIALVHRLAGARAFTTIFVLANTYLAGCFLIMSLIMSVRYWP